jgi:hypothetical protein
MAGVKVTDLITLGTADPADVMYIVDSSSNQSKQIEVQNIYSGMPQLESGAFTPADSNVTNSGIITVYAGTYSRVGDVVTMAFRMDVQMDAAETSTSFNLSIPVASNFTSRYNLNGALTANTYFESCYIEADHTVNDLITVSINSTGTGDFIENLGVVIQYIVL